jgi:alkylated DNA repair dioxygenase AlkB
MSDTPTIPGLRLIEDYLGADEQQRLLDTIDAQPWLTDLRRRVQHYGYRYDYTTRSLHAAAYLGPLPPWAAELADRLRRDGLFANTPDQLIVNEYQPGQGIAAHIDCEPCFGDTIASLSLGSACVMDFIAVEDGREVPVLLRPCSLVLMTGEARYDWKHRIKARKTDRFDNETITRGRRVSLTLRNVILARDTPQ